MAAIPGTSRVVHPFRRAALAIPFLGCLVIGGCSSEDDHPAAGTISAATGAGQGGAGDPSGSGGGSAGAGGSGGTSSRSVRCAADPDVVDVELPPASPTEGSPSPTGRDPMFVWTPQQQTVWLQMKAEYEQNPADPPSDNGKLYKLMKDNAECGCRYSDTGLWATMMYQITGDTTYVDLALAKWLETGLFANPSEFQGNAIREHAIENVIIYDWLYPALTSEQRSAFIEAMNTALEIAVVDPRLNDSDQTTGVYFAIALFYLATHEENPTAKTLLEHPVVGGLDSTSSDLSSTMRNAVRHYAETLAAGGEWIESTEYNMGTTGLLTMGYRGARTATEQDHFPEIAKLLPMLAERDAYAVTADLEQVFQWGDEQEARSFLYVFRRQTSQGMLQGATQDTLEGARLLSLLKGIFAKYGVVGYGAAEPWQRFFLFYNPYAPEIDWRTAPRCRFAKGQALLLHRDGFEATDSLFGVIYKAEQDVDHTPQTWGSFQLYRKGEWGLTHPIGYGGPAVLGTQGGVNGMMLEGFPLAYSMVAEEVQRVVAQQSGPGFSYVAGTTGGQTRAQGYYNPPPTFAHEWTRSVVYLSAGDQRSDTIVTFDRTHTVDPTTLPGFASYKPAEQTGILAAKEMGRKQWVIHSPVAPTEAADGLSWVTAGGQHAHVATLLPLSQERVVLDEKTLLTSIQEKEQKWQTRIVSNQDWEVFLNVVQVHDADFTPDNLLVRDTVAHVDAVLVRRSGLSETLLAFNATPSPDLPPDLPGSATVYDPAREGLLVKAHSRTEAFSLAWSSETTTEVMLFDLDPSISWSYRVGNRPDADLDVSDQGLALLQLEGAGERTLVVEPKL